MVALGHPCQQLLELAGGQVVGVVDEHQVLALVGQWRLVGFP